MKLTIDRIEENFAVCETENGMTDIPLENLPDGLKPGAVLVRTENGFVIDKNETENARQKNISLLNKLKSKGKNQKK